MEDRGVQYPVSCSTKMSSVPAKVDFSFPILLRFLVYCFCFLYWKSKHTQVLKVKGERQEYERKELYWKTFLFWENIINLYKTVHIVLLYSLQYLHLIISLQYCYNIGNLKIMNNIQDMLWSPLLTVPKLSNHYNFFLFIYFLRC